MLALITLLSNSFANNADDNWRKGFSGGYMEIRYGILNYDDDTLNRFFNQGENQVLLVDAGTSIYRFFDVGIGFGRSKSQGYLLSADGSVSSEVDELRVLPMSVHGTARAHLWQEQLIIPFGGYGMDYWLWKETWGGEVSTIDTSTDTTTDSTETDITTSTSEQKTLNGGKIGSHYRFGVEILLDKFDRVGESKLYNNFRIEDTYLVVEQRFFDVGEEGEGFVFDGKATTFGFRFHY